MQKTCICPRFAYLRTDQLHQKNITFDVHHRTTKGQPVNTLQLHSEINKRGGSFLDSIINANLSVFTKVLYQPSLYLPREIMVAYPMVVASLRYYGWHQWKDFQGKELKSVWSELLLGSHTSKPPRKIQKNVMTAIRWPERSSIPAAGTNTGGHTRISWRNTSRPLWLPRSSPG